MKSISIYKVNFRNPVAVKIVCDGFGYTHEHYFVLFSLAEFSTTVLTLSVFGFTSLKVYLKSAPGEYNINVEL